MRQATVRTVYEILYVRESVTETEHCHETGCLNFSFRPEQIYGRGKSPVACVTCSGPHCDYEQPSSQISLQGTIMLLVKITESGVEEPTSFSILQKRAHPGPNPPVGLLWPLTTPLWTTFSFRRSRLHSWTGVTGCSHLEGAHQQSADGVYYAPRSIQSVVTACDLRSRFVAVLLRCSNTSLLATRKVGRVFFCCPSRLRGHRSHPWIVLRFYRLCFVFNQLCGQDVMCT
jgi:hypothetical protein